MKRNLITISIMILTLAVAAPLARAQGGAKRGPVVGGDTDLDKDAMHNLEVALDYFHPHKKAYVASLERCEEILAANPGFSRIDQVLFVAGESSLNLSESKGNQKPSQYVMHDGDKKITLTPQEFKDKAREYLSQLIKDHPDSAFRGRAEDDLRALGVAKTEKHHSEKKTK